MQPSFSGSSIPLETKKQAKYVLFGLYFERLYSVLTSLVQYIYKGILIFWMNL